MSTLLTPLSFDNRFEFVVTASDDGHVKFWKKTENDIEFVKHFRAHLGTQIKGQELTQLPLLADYKTHTVTLCVYLFQGALFPWERALTGI